MNYGSTGRYSIKNRIIQDMKGSILFNPIQSLNTRLSAMETQTDTSNPMHNNDISLIVNQEPRLSIPQSSFKLFSSIWLNRLVELDV